MTAEASPAAPVRARPPGPRGLQPLLAVLGVVLALAWGLAWSRLSTLQTALEAAELAQQQAVVLQVASELDHTLRAKVDGLAIAAARLDLARLSDGAYLRAFLEDRRLSDAGFSAGTFVFDLHGTALADHPEIAGRRGSHHRDDAYFRMALVTGRPHIGRPWPAPGLARPSLPISVPVLDADGRVRAVLMGALDLGGPDVLGVVTEARRLGRAELQVVSADDNHLVASSSEARVRAWPVGSGTPPGAGSAAGPDQVHASARVPVADWMVLQSLSSGPAFPPSHRLGSTTLVAGGGAATVVALLVAAGVSRRAPGLPVSASGRTAGASTGDVPLRPPEPKGEREGRRLLSSFGRLTRRLMSQRTRLERLASQRGDELAGRERFLQALADALPGWVSYWTPQLQCGFANRRQLEWLGVGEAGRIVAAGQGRFPIREAHLRTSLRGERQVLEQDWAAPDGAGRPVLVHLIPDQVGTVLRGVFVIATDASALRQVGHDLAQARVMAEAAALAKSRFLANMSHEIRTPMNAIIGLTHLLARDAGNVRDRDRLRKVDGAARHLLRMFDDLLALSMGAAGTLVLHDVEFSRDEWLAGVIGQVRQAAAAKGLALVVDTKRLPAHLRGDPKRMAQALIALLDNAVSFTEHGGVRLQGAPLAEEGDRLLLRFEVQDSGIGVEAQRLAALFGDFEQGDASTTRRHGGTGLGLALTRRVATLMGGEAGGVSQPGEGSRFWFTGWVVRTAATGLPAAGPAGHGQHECPGDALPATAEDAPPGEAERLLRRHHAGRRVMLAEDNPVNQQVACELLGAVGLVVEVAADGGQAVDLVLARSYDLGLMDLQMPGIDGLDATRAIRQRLGPALPIVAMTADVQAADRQACHDAGMDDHLAKP
ncbi:MAG: response regulator, partial [Ideonella sp.]|nr:response regulator [Ideonella sp.]